MEKVVSLKKVRIEKQYRDFYSKLENYNLSRNVFFKCDVVEPKKVRIS